MDYTEFSELAKRWNLEALKAFYAYDKEQAQLGVKNLLTPELMSTPEGVVQLNAVVGHLRDVTAKHKSAFEAAKQNSIAELAAGIKSFPIEDHADLGRVVNIVSWQFESQDRFYENRERWLGAVAGLCELIDSQWKGVSNAQNNAVRFGALVDEMQETQMLEQQILSERESRLRMSSEVLGMVT